MSNPSLSNFNLLVEQPKDFLSEQFFQFQPSAALPLLVELFLERRNDLLKDRFSSQKKFRQNTKVMASFPFGSSSIRKAPWMGKKNARTQVNSPLKFLDLEDGLPPHWNLRLDSLSSDNLKEHSWIKPRGLHLDERHFSVHGRYIPAALFDLYFSLQKRERREDWVGIILPKIESAVEARFWSDLLFWLEDHFGLRRTSLEVCVVFETVTGCAEAEEILFELKDRATSIDFDPYDYTFSWMKFFGATPENLFFQSEKNELQNWTAPLATYLSDLAERREFAFLGAVEVVHPIPVSFLHNAPKGSSVPTIRHLEQLTDRCLQYLASSLKGEKTFDLAEFEFTRSLIWQWVRFQVPMDDGTRLTTEKYLLEQKKLQIQSDAPEVRLFHSFLLKESLLDYSVPSLFKHLKVAAATPL